MKPEPLSLVVFNALLEVELSVIEDAAIRRVARATLIPPRPDTRIPAASSRETWVAWIFAETPDQKRGAAYCDRGRAYREAQWGVVSLDDAYFGPDRNWYPSVNDLMATWVAAW